MTWYIVHQPETGGDQDPPHPSPSVQNALDSQGFLGDSFLAVVLDSSHPPEPAESHLGCTAADAASASETPGESDFGSAAVDAASVSETSSAAGTSADPIPVPVKPERKILGRRAPALLTEPINFLSRVRTAPVLVTSAPNLLLMLLPLALMLVRRTWILLQI